MNRAPILLLVLPLALALVAAKPQGDPEAAQTAARAAVDGTVASVLAVLRNGELSHGNRVREIEVIAYQRFDFQTISKLVLARNYKKLTPQQREEFTLEFKRHLSLTYGERIGEYKNERVEITNSRYEKNADVTVMTRVVGEQPEPYLVDYRLRQDDDTGEWLVIDVIVEDVSMVANFRDQMKEIISRHGTEGLIDKLREKNNARNAKEGVTG